jgi:hypothetical protein
VGSVAVAQQGLIVEPWKQAAAAQKAVAPSRPVPEPTLAAARLAAPTPLPRVEVAASVAPPLRWTPPVVELLVDPWAKQQQAERQARPRWVPQTREIIDPWADEIPVPPRVAAAGEHSTIF